MLAVSALSVSGAYVAAPALRPTTAVRSADAQMGLLTAVKGLFGSKKQDFLEADPYWDQSTVPVNTYKNKAPFTAKVISTKRIVGPEATGETCHIIMNHQGKMPYWEGQSYGVIPP